MLPVGRGDPTMSATHTATVAVLESLVLAVAAGVNARPTMQGGKLEEMRRRIIAERAAPGTTLNALFEFDDVRIVRGDTEVLAGVDVAIPDGGITAVVGASGSGKSTLLRCCNRLEVPTSGHVAYRGADVATLDPLGHRRRVAMVFQAPVVFAGIRARQPAGRRPAPRPRRRVVAPVTGRLARRT